MIGLVSGVTYRKRNSVRLFDFNLLTCGCRSFWFATLSLLAGCAAHTKEQPAPTYPPAPESALEELRAPPPVRYARLALVTVVAEPGNQLARSIQRARELAAQKGANAIVLLRARTIAQRSGKKTVKVIRITYLAIRRL
jgi:hypothetical protein